MQPKFLVRVLRGISYTDPGRCNVSSVDLKALKAFSRAVSERDPKGSNYVESSSARQAATTLNNLVPSL